MLPHVEYASSTGRLGKHTGLLHGTGGCMGGGACWTNGGNIVGLLNVKDGRGTWELAGERWGDRGNFECCQNVECSLRRGR